MPVVCTSCANQSLSFHYVAGATTVAQCKKACENEETCQYMQFQTKDVGLQADVHMCILLNGCNQWHTQNRSTCGCAHDILCDKHGWSSWRLFRNSTSQSTLSVNGSRVDTRRYLWRLGSAQRPDNFSAAWGVGTGRPFDGSNSSFSCDGEVTVGIGWRSSDSASADQPCGWPPCGDKEEAKGKIVPLVDVAKCGSGGEPCGAVLREIVGCVPRTTPHGTNNFGSLHLQSDTLDGAQCRTIERKGLALIRGPASIEGDGSIR